ncbi:TetR/AcrR family transcriptional regulator [Actinoplanes sp. CA-030573]|uniref:TetR/AcrR family transcriptional regulator n=1 Tax=Actinoplanes sp. CA-030573 TaxID=3239898 RepID=UPI003D9403D6
MHPVPDPPARRRADAERNREAILGAADEVLRMNPAASFEDIIIATGRGRTTVYRHFPTRNHIVAALVDRALEVVHALLEQARPTEPPFDAALERMTRAALVGGHRAWSLITVAAGGRVPDSPPLTQIVAAATELMRLGVTEHRLRDDIPLDWHVESYFQILTLALRDGLGEGATEIVVDVFCGGASAAR